MRSTHCTARSLNAFELAHGQRNCAALDCIWTPAFDFASDFSYLISGGRGLFRGPLQPVRLPAKIKCNCARFSMIEVRPPYAMSGTDIAYGASDVRY
eukprot:884930-Rhodomonas_salina.1